jgi:hypothetical protein
VSDEQANTTQIMPADGPVLGGDDLIAMAQQVEKRIAAVKRIKAAALAVTNKHDWIDQDGKPYLWVSGAEKVARLFGISWRIDPPTLEVDPDGHYAYIYKGEFSLGTATIDVIGSRSSKDPFFSRSKGQNVPPDQIDRQDVRKSAYTNCIGNGVTRLLGIRNMTWEEVEEFGSFKRGDAKGVKREGKGEMSEEAKSQRDEIRRMVLEMAGGDGGKAKNMLAILTSFIGKNGEEIAGKRSVTELSEKAVPVSYGKIKKSYEQWVASGEEAGGGLGDGDAGNLEF